MEKIGINIETGNLLKKEIIAGIDLGNTNIILPIFTSKAKACCIEEA